MPKKQQKLSPESAVEAIVSALDSAEIAECISPYAGTGSTPLDLDHEAVATAIEGAGDDLPLDLARFRALERALERMPAEHADRIAPALRRWARAHWLEIADELRARAEQAFGRLFDSSFENIVAEWPALRADAALREDALEAAIGQTRGFGLDELLGRLRSLRGDPSAARRVLTGVLGSLRDEKTRRALVDLFGAWAPDDRFGWLLGRFATSDADDGRRPSDAVATAARLLSEAGLSPTGSTPFDLFALAPETRASWRRDLDEVCGEDLALRSAAVEAVLLFGPHHRDRDLLVAALEVAEPDVDGILAPLLHNPSDIVRRRARAVLGTAAGEPDLSALTTARIVSRSAAARVGAARARTWIGDARFELALRDRLHEAAMEFAEEIGTRLGSGEQRLETILFERLRAALRAASERLRIFAAATDANERIEIRLEHRWVGTPEEGAPGLGSERFSTDICLLFTAVDHGRTFARRACLLQSKRQSLRAGRPYFRIEPEQLKDLWTQTEAGFLLCLGPAIDDAAFPLVPARLLTELAQRPKGSRSQLTPADATMLGRGIADWLTYDVVGLWAGSWDEKVIARAEGTGDHRPFLLVSIEAERIRRGPDG